MVRATPSAPNHNPLTRSGNISIFTLIALLLFLSIPVVSTAETLQEMNAWTYHQEWDKATNTKYSLTRSPVPRRGANDNLRIELICKDNVLQLAVEALSLITSKGSRFDFEYQIDKAAPVTMSMTAYSDSKRRGYTDQDVVSTIDEILSGHTLFIRVHTLIGTVLSSVIPLDNAVKPIQKVLADCGVERPGGRPSSSNYSLEDFERSFKALPTERQRQVLDKIKEFINNSQ